MCDFRVGFCDILFRVVRKFRIELRVFSVDKVGECCIGFGVVVTLEEEGFRGKK